MGARSGGGGGAGMGGGVAGRMKSDYLSGLDKDISSYDNPTGAAAKLIGDTQEKALNDLKASIGEIKGAKSYSDVEKHTSNVQKAFSKFDSQMQEKIDVLKHNSQLAKGKSKQTYASAISSLEMTQWKVGQSKSKYSYGHSALGGLEQHFISKNKWS